MSFSCIKTSQQNSIETKKNFLKVLCYKLTDYVPPIDYADLIKLCHQDSREHQESFDCGYVRRTFLGCYLLEVAVSPSSFFEQFCVMNNS